MTMVQMTVIGDGSTLMPVTVVEASQPAAAVLEVVPVELSQVIDVADVSSEPPSRKFTWMSERGGSVNVAVAPAPGRLLPQSVPLATVTDLLPPRSRPYPAGAVVSLTV